MVMIRMVFVIMNFTAKYLGKKEMIFNIVNKVDKFCIIAKKK